MKKMTIGEKSLILNVIVFFIVIIGTNVFAQTPNVRFPATQTSLTDPIINIMDGPDADAIYVRIRPGSHRFIDPPLKYIYKTDNDVLIQMNGFQRDQDPGNPALNYQIFRVALPPDVVDSSIQVSVVQQNEVPLKGAYEIAPAPPFVYDTSNQEELERLEEEKWGIGKQIVNGRNVLVYNKDAWYPEKGYRVDVGGRMRKWKVASLTFYPFRHNPVKKQLTKSNGVILKISFQRDVAVLEHPDTKAFLRDTKADKRAEKLFLNFEKAKQWYLPKPAPRPVPNEGLPEGEDLPEDDVPPGGADYAIITTDQIFTNTPELTDFCFHKQDQGYFVIVVTEHQTHKVTGDSGAYAFTTDAGGFEDVVGDAPDGTAEKIRSWLQANYIALGIEYVLLVGNPDPDNVDAADAVGDIPMQLCWTSFTGDRPSDLYYADLTGDWNVDDDWYVGENYDIAGYSVLPAGVVGNLFCVRWEGVIEVVGAAGATNVRVKGDAEGQIRFWVDTGNDGFTDADLIIDDPDEHHPSYHSQTFGVAGDGTYTVRIEYKQTNDDAYCSLSLHNYNDGVDRAFKHDDGTGVYVDGLEGSFYNDNDFSAPVDAAEISSASNVKVIFIEGGDRGLGGVDFYPEVLVGRIPCYDEDNDGSPDYATLGNILTKSITYETANIHDETWRLGVLISTPYMYDWDDVPGYETADYKGGEYLMDNVAPPPLWNWYRIHEEDYADVVPDAEVNSGCSVNETVGGWNDPADPDDGRGIVMWRTHGWQTGASHVFTDNRCVDLDDTKPSMVIQTTCQNGHPEVETSWDGSRHFPLGFSLLKQGAVATISSTRNSVGGTFDPANISINYKNNPYLMYFFAKGLMDNVPIGRVLAHVKEADATTGNWWGNLLNYNIYGDPSVSMFGQTPRTNNDIVFLLDGSGSMLNENKWTAAVDATVLFYQLMKELRHESFQDRYASVVFKWDNSAGADITTTVPAGTGLQGLDVVLTKAQLDAETPVLQNFTPIGEGLVKAIEQFDMNSEDSFYSNKTILLLSDGKQNRGVDPLDVPIPARIVVHAVGLGEDSIEPDTISDIAGAAGGDFRISPSPREIEDFFVQILCNTSWKLQDVTVTGTTAPIDQDIAVFVLVWDDPAMSIGFELDPPGGGANITPATLDAYPGMDVTYHAPAAGERHAFYTLKNISDDLLGEWQFINITDGAAPVAIDNVLLKVVEDPRTIADFAIEPGDYYMGQPIILTATITEDGNPKTGLTDVSAELIRSPAIHVGDAMADNTPPPDYPKEPASATDRTLRAHYLLGVMKTLGLSTLTSLDSSTIILRDNGQGADRVANDGEYTGSFVNTEKEGSYTFKFRARGKNASDINFDRTETISEYLKFAIIPEESVIEMVASIEADNFLKTTLKVTPCGIGGVKMGPFYGDTIQLYSDIGQISPDYVDNRDGTYTFTISHPKNTKPKITVSVGNVLIAEQFQVQKKQVDRSWLWIIILLIVIFIVIYILIKKKKS